MHGCKHSQRDCTFLCLSVIKPKSVPGLPLQSMEKSCRLWRAASPISSGHVFSRWLGTEWNILSENLSTLTVKLGVWKWPSGLLPFHSSLNYYIYSLNRNKILQYFSVSLKMPSVLFEQFQQCVIGNISSFTLILRFNKNSYIVFELFNWSSLSEAKFLLIHNLNGRSALWGFVFISCH